MYREYDINDNRATITTHLGVRARKERCIRRMFVPRGGKQLRHLPIVL